MARRGTWTMVVALLLAPAVVSAGKQKEEKVEGYAEWRVGNCLLVDGQRVCPGPEMEFKGKGAALDFARIPLGYEVKAKGLRNADGAVLAKKLEAKPNGMAMFEGKVVQSCNAMEAAFRRHGHMLEQVDEENFRSLGKLHESGPQVDRVKRIVRRLLPPYVDPRDVRVYVVESDDWNAMAMGNHSIYVFTALLGDMDDDEVAIILGHEIAHATHEHVRRGFKKAMWIQLAALGLSLVNENVKDEQAQQILGLVGQYGSLAWKNGYGRSQEDQADRVGLRYAYEAGYDITKGPELWRRFARKYGEADVVQNFFFSDHSMSSKRAEHLERELAVNYPTGPKRTARKRATRRASAPPPPPPTTPRQVTAGMSTTDVQALLGAPGDQLEFGRRSRWIYQEVTVVFEEGVVTDVRF